MPVFEGLLPDPHDENLLDLLFVLSHWHALAKLRQHTELSLAVMESVTIELGSLLRKFQETTCPVFDTRELNREESARKRRAEATGRKRSGKKKQGVAALDAETTADSSESKRAAGKLRKTLNLKTYKDHSLGDYVETIRQNGTTDSYSTEIVIFVFVFCR